MIELAKRIFSKDFMLLQSSASDFRSLLPLIIVFGGIIILAILTMIFFAKLNPLKAQIRSRITSWMMSLGLVGLVAVFFRWQNLGAISKNIFLASVIVVWFIWLFIILEFITFKYPKEKYTFIENQRIRKYLPKAKKKKRK